MADSLELKNSLPQGHSDTISERYIDWGAIIGGALLAVILSFILFTFGSALGLSAISAEPEEGISLRWVAIAGGIWLIWTMVTSSAAGGYFAGRMRKPAGDVNDDEIETRDGAHGLVSWAVAALLTLTLAAMGIGNTLSSVTHGASSLIGSSAEGIGSLIEENSSELAELVLRNQNALPSEAAREEIATILTRSVQKGDVSESDRSYLAQVVARETSLDANEARTRIDQAVIHAEQVREKTIEAAEQARIFSLISAFILAASLLAAAATAYFAAVLGGEHRNNNVGFGNTGNFYTFKRNQAIITTDNTTASASQQRNVSNNHKVGGKKS